MKAKTAQHKRDLGFSTTINLQPGDNDRFQLVYFTHLYETLFVLYARFDVEMSSNPNADKKIKEIEFLGVNYKGPINLKIEDIQVRIDKTKSSQDDEEKLTLLKMDLTLSGTGTGTFTRPVNEIMTINLEVPNDASFRLERTLRSMCNFEPRVKNDGFEGYNLPDDAFWNGIFDSEFFIRDGFLVAPKSGRGKLFRFAEELHLQDHVTGKMKQKGSVPAAVGINCPIGVGLINPGS